MRSSKDLARRLRFDHFPRGDAFRRRYALVGLVVTVLGVALWAVLHLGFRERQYVPGPVSASHATFGDRCEACHTAFAAVKNESCETCHGKSTHAAFATRVPACSECHVEHRDGTMLDVASARCIACHGDLETTNPAPVIQRQIATFAAHPELAPLRPPARDPAALRFNHKVHLGSPNVLVRPDPDASGRVVQRPLVCADCHLPDARGRLMRPIAFATHCRSCHKLELTALPVGIEALHDTPEVIRPDLAAKLVVAAFDHPELFQGEDPRIPGIRGRPPVDTSRTLGEYQATWLARLETELYQPFDDRRPLFDNNKRCFLCHIEAGSRTPGALPAVAPSNVPKRWLVRGEFSHDRHEMLACATCHVGVEQSAETANVNLPDRHSCERCHVDARPESAGTRCTLCHLYHDTTKDRLVRVMNRKLVPLERLQSQ